MFSVPPFGGVGYNVGLEAEGVEGALIWVIMKGGD